MIFSNLDSDKPNIDDFINIIGKDYLKLKEDKKHSNLHALAWEKSHGKYFKF
jgi:hypothetical protein